MVNFWYYAHSGLRWLVVLSTLIALGFMLYSLITNRHQDGATRGIMVTFSSLIGVQWILGLVLYLIYGNMTNNFSQRPWVEHLTTMTIVLIVAHLYLPFRRRLSDRGYYIASTVVILVVIALVWVGVAQLSGGTMTRWQFAPMYAPQ